MVIQEQELKGLCLESSKSIYANYLTVLVVVSVRVEENFSRKLIITTLPLLVGTASLLWV